MRVNRQSDLTEKYKITSDWLDDFAYDLEKNAEHTDYLKQYLEQRRIKEKKYNSIEEKMADIKQRIGFDLARKINDEISKTSQNDIPTSNLNTEAKVATAEYKHSERDIKLMSNILKYITDLIKHEPHVDLATVLSRCKNEDGLKFDELSIDSDKLKDYISKQLAKTEHKTDENIGYIPASGKEHGFEDEEADYYSHSRPKA